MLIVSLSIRVLGIETARHFRYAPACSLAAKCDGCGSRSRATLAPVELYEDSTDSPTPAGLPLCKACSTIADNRWNAEWPTLTTGGAVSVWSLVQAEQDRETACLSARESAPRTSLEELEGMLRTAQQAAANQSINRVGKVA